MIHVVLVHPEIPWNTGNIGRTCVGVGAELHLVEPLGFALDDKFLKRAGLDYWGDLRLTVHRSLRELLRSPFMEGPVYLFSRFGKRRFWDVDYPDGSVLVFGSETAGLSNSLKKRFSGRLVRIPTPGPVRSLNLSTAVGIALFEALRQHDTVPTSRRILR
jgi:tRNA (cytidine/uridine-2'-O-)-methyltransferase